MKRMSRFVVGVCLLTLLSISAGTHAATLIGDDLIFRTQVGSNPNITNNPLTVQEGVIEYENFSFGRHDIEAESIYVDWDNIGLGSIGWDSTLTQFDYLDLDWTDQPGKLIDVTLTTNIAGLDDSKINFGDDFVSVLLTGLSVFGPGPNLSYYQLDLQVSEVPVPPALLLFASGLFWIAGLARRTTA